MIDSTSTSTKNTIRNQISSRKNSDNIQVNYDGDKNCGLGVEKIDIQKVILKLFHYLNLYVGAGQIGRPPPRPFIFYSIFSICHFIGKRGVFLNARRICYAKTTFFSDKTSCTVSGKIFKRKNVVLGRVLAYFLMKAPFAPPALCAAGQPDRWRRYKRPPAGEP